MEKKNIDWSSIGFGYIPTDYRYVANFKDGKWDNSSYLKKYKEGIHSTLMRAKKFYSLRDLD